MSESRISGSFSAKRAASSLLGAASVLASAAAAAWTPIPVADEPLVRMPGTQPQDGVSLEAPTRCLNCHAGYDQAVEPGHHWKGSMMAQAARDPIFWASMAVALQDSIWLIGNANAGDLCLRCHSPSGWLGGRSDPPNGAALTGADFDGVLCDGCHRAYDPFFEDTYAGLRESSDWLGYWDETGTSATPSGPAATATRALDRIEAATSLLFNGNPSYDSGTFTPLQAAWDENGGGQYFAAASNDKRASFADADARHNMAYSRYHKSRYFCGTCHDVSNPALANWGYADTAVGDGSTVLPSESQPAYAYGHLERTFSEFMLSDYGVGGGTDGIGPYAPGVFATSRPGNQIAACQDCHMPDAVGYGADLNGTIFRPSESTEHPKSGVPTHDLTGGNVLVPWILASTIPGTPSYDAVNAALLDQGPNVLTLDLSQGVSLNGPALLAGVDRALANLQRAAAIEGLTYTSSTGQIDFRVQNQTAHKLISGYPEGRRMWVNIRAYRSGALVWELNPYSDVEDTLVGLADSAYSPALGSAEAHEDALIYEVTSSSSLTGEGHTFHMVLSDARYKDNRIPPQGFRINEAAARLAEPVWHGASDPGYFDAAEYAGGYDAIGLVGEPDADGIEVSLRRSRHRWGALRRRRSLHRG